MGLAKREGDRRGPIGCSPVREAEHIRFFIQGQTIDGIRRTGPKVGLPLAGIDNALLVQDLPER